MQASYGVRKLLGFLFWKSRDYKTFVLLASSSDCCGLVLGVKIFFSRKIYNCEGFCNCEVPQED